MQLSIKKAIPLHLEGEVGGTERLRQGWMDASKSSVEWQKWSEGEE